MKRSAVALLALLFLFSAAEGRADVHIGDLEIFLSRLEIRVNKHERDVNERIAMQKKRIVELEDRIVKLEALLREKKGASTNRPVAVSPASL